mmetsp:Transcript_65627/g.133507  ORF Transcript_65627/g.133507 Transcript_65627/m.133507 type:complete len:88 (+) Transcript_65627:474-737(+)
MMKMIGFAISQFANAMATHSNGTAGSSNMSAVFTPGQAPRFEGLNGEPITLPPPPPEDNDNEDLDEGQSPPQKRRFRTKEGQGRNHS